MSSGKDSAAANSLPLTFFIMNTQNLKLTDLKNLLSRFFDKNFEPTNMTLVQAERVLFHGTSMEQLDLEPQLTRTLRYLKNIMGRNSFTTLNELLGYYDIKRKKMQVLFEELEKTDPEECFAVSFQEAYTTHMRKLKQEHEFVKNDCFYNFGMITLASAIEVFHNSPMTIPVNQITLQHAREHLSQVKGNQFSILRNNGQTSGRTMQELVEN